jgi:hypothetical protein
MWYEWDSLESFNAWHKAICTSLGIPDELTTAYTVAYPVENKFIAFVEDAHSEGLVLTSLAFRQVERD